MKNLSLHIAEILHWPFKKPLRAILFLAFVAAWPHLIYALNDAVRHAQGLS